MILCVCVTVRWLCDCVGGGMGGWVGGVLLICMHMCMLSQKLLAYFSLDKLFLSGPFLIFLKFVISSIIIFYVTFYISLCSHCCERNFLTGTMKLYVSEFVFCHRASAADCERFQQWLEEGIGGHQPGRDAGLHQLQERAADFAGKDSSGIMG